MLVEFVILIAGYEIALAITYSFKSLSADHKEFAMARVIWKGALSFGLLHAPVSLYPATQQDEIDFDWLQRDTLEPVGYKRVIKKTGEEVSKEEVVKAVKQDDGSYVVLSDQEIESANVKSTHTVDIVSFVDAKELPFVYFETPYFVAPSEGGEKLYALLREALLETRKVGIALVVLHNKQHLAALIPTPQALYLNTLRWATEIKSPDALHLPHEGLKATAIKQKELAMAVQLIDSMAEEWDPSQYKDTFRDDIMVLVKKKITEGKAKSITTEVPQLPAEEEEEVDLVELLKRSLQGVPAPVRRVTRSRSHGKIAH
jgi:DNA end-binding protein Ku